jgi:hypothetical protein
MDYVKYLAAKAIEFRNLAEAAEDDAVYDELIVVANVCSDAAAAIELHNLSLDSRAKKSNSAADTRA